MSYDNRMYPLKMKPFLKDYIWGGTRLMEGYGKKTGLHIVAESWEVSCHRDGESVVENGPLSGQALSSVLKRYPEWMGPWRDKAAEFPLLIKLIDARQRLSLQVHPDDEYARRVEQQAGKNEMWYILEAQPGAELILGFERPLARSDIKEAIIGNELLAAVNRVPVQAGDCYCVPAGLIHAIGEGILIIEVQQTSNVTYRVYDYDRKDSNGNARILHIDKALDVIDASLLPQKSEGAVLADWPFFTCELIIVDGNASLDRKNDSFQCVTVIDGQLSATWKGGSLLLRKGDSVFVPATMRDVCLTGVGKVIWASEFPLCVA